jgi:hypothetical protein
MQMNLIRIHRYILAVTGFMDTYYYYNYNYYYYYYYYYYPLCRVFANIYLEQTMSLGHVV